MIGVDGGAGAAPGAGRRLRRDDTHCWWHTHIFIQDGALGSLSARERGKVAPSNGTPSIWLVGKE